MKVVIMAGGKGTRISSVASDIPKPMIKIEGTPVLEREIECLKEQGFDDILITVSHLGNIIMDYFGDGSGNSPVTGQPFGVHIEYYFEREPLGNAGALFKIKDKLTEDFLLLNADAMFDVDFNRFVEYHKQHDGLVTLFTHPNSHPYDSGLIIADKNGAVEKWLAKEDERPLYYRNRVNAGLHVINPEVLALFGIDAEAVGKIGGDGKSVKVDLDRQLLKPLAGTGKMFCYDSPEYVKDMGTPDRYYSVCADYREGRVTGKNLKNKQKAILAKVVTKKKDIYLVIAGDGDFFNDVKSLSAGMGLNDNIVFLGYRNDPQNVIQQVDSVALCSYTEGLPLTPIEAFAHGKPMIATPVGGTVEIVKNEINGVIVSPGNIDEIASSILDLACDKEKYLKLARNAEKCYYEEFSYEIFESQVLSLYENL